MKTLKACLVVLALAALIGMAGATIRTYQDIARHQLHPWEVQMARVYGKDWHSTHLWYARTNQTLYYQLRITQYRLMAADPTLTAPAPNWIGWQFLTNREVTIAASAN
jgi:hypothetical protein